ncbi:MAG: SpoIID/LytB domain-containing protein [Phormidesmis sp.]
MNTLFTNKSSVKGPVKIPAKGSAKASDTVVPLVDPLTASVEVSTSSAQPKAARRLAEKFSNLPKRKVAVVLGLLGASTGLAFTSAKLLPAQANAPLSRVNDPTAESVLEPQSLFLTNEIFYRKIEAIAKVPRAQATLADPLQKGTASEKTAQSAAAQAAAAKAAAVKEAEQVKAAAPPAPKVAPPTFSGTTIDSVLEMRVALAKDVSAIAFATSGKGTIADLDGNVLKSLSPESSVLAETGSGIIVDGQTMPNAFWIYPEDGGYVAIGDSWYRGRVLMAQRGDRGLIAVNHVLLGDYLYSVVGGEMSPSWAIESLKAQAVAARSYALTHNIHPASEEYFDLDNTPRFQSYQGIAREANTTQAAVQSTAGEFISHEGGIVESLYAASQDIVDDAHSGSGMSQLGARDLADQGYSYMEILAHYYPTTAIGRIETDAQ